MKKFLAYKLKFLGPLHLGQEGIGLEKAEEALHSDTLFSAITCKWPLIYDDDIDNFIKNPPFLISSAFPFQGNEYFLPRPMIRIGREGEEHPEYGKKLKKVKFVSRKVFERLMNGEPIGFLEKNTLQEGSVWTDYETESLIEDEKIIYRIRELPRVIVDRMTNSSEIFYFNEIVFSKNSGLFFLVKFRDEKVRSKFEAVLRLLGDEGIGGDKSSGKGCFNIEIVETFTIKFPESSIFFTVLSLYHPTREEIQKGLLENSSYGLINRRGWIHSISPTSLRRRGLRMFVEGSVFKNIGGEVYGDVINVLGKNEKLGLFHNVYRYGLSLAIPTKLEGEDV